MSIQSIYNWQRKEASEGLFVEENENLRNLLRMSDGISSLLGASSNALITPVPQATDPLTYHISVLLKWPSMND